MISFSYTLTVILLVAAVTLLTRALPFILFPGDKALPPFIHYLGQVLPFAVMGMLVIYCLKGMPAAHLSENAATLLSVAAVVALHLWKKNTLLSIAGGTALYMALLHII
jgi:branched-subunit amino acid transport protein AzlD